MIKYYEDIMKKNTGKLKLRGNLIFFKRKISTDFYKEYQFSSVASHVWLFATRWTAACQTSLSITNSWSLLKLMSIELVMPSNHLILCLPLLLLPLSFSASGSFPMTQFFISGAQSTGLSASASVLSMNIQD